MVDPGWCRDSCRMELRRVSTRGFLSLRLCSAHLLQTCTPIVVITPTITESPHDRQPAHHQDRCAHGTGRYR